MKTNFFSNNGWLNLNKKAGVSSARIVGKLKKHFSLRKIGHLGTLDPEAEGVLPLALGEATKTIQFISNKIKIYRFVVRWGQETNTLDHEGYVTRISNYIPDEKQIRKTLKKYFIGNILQRPPSFSAVKIKGERAYILARKKIEFEISEKNIKIYYFKWLRNPDEKHSEFEVKCGPGTYVRSLANDLAIKMGTFAHTLKIVRTNDSFFNIKKAINFESLMNMDNMHMNKILYPVEYLLKNFQILNLEKKYLEPLRNGKTTYVDFLKEKLVKKNESILIKNQGKLVSVANLEKGYIIPKRNFNN